MAKVTDEYATWRTAADASRLSYNHFLWREHYKSNVHPAILLDRDAPLQIAEFATGHGLWAIQVAEEFPNAQVQASDVSLALLPAKPDLPLNLTVRKWSSFDPVPDEWKSAFDLIHIRLVVQPFAGQDPRDCLAKFVSMLKPGGYLQWDEGDYHSPGGGTVYTSNDPKQIPHPDQTHGSSAKLRILMAETFRWPTDHLHRLGEYFSATGLEDVQVYRQAPPRAIFRASYEHWLDVCVQLTPLIAARDAEAGREAQRLLDQIRRDAEEGVYSAQVRKWVFGRKPVGDVVNGANRPR